MSLNKDISNLSDDDLLDLYRVKADMKVIGELFRRYLPFVYGICLKYFRDREKSKDAAMNIFEELPKKVTQHEIRNFKSWLHVTSRNFCLMQLRKKSIENASVEFQSDFMEIPENAHHDNEMELESDLDRLKYCMEQLKLDQQKCVKLFYLDKKSYNEIEELTQYEIKKVKSHIQNGKRNLKICMESNG